MGGLKEGASILLSDTESFGSVVLESSLDEDLSNEAGEDWRPYQQQPGQFRMGLLEALSSEMGVRSRFG